MLTNVDTSEVQVNLVTRTKLSILDAPPRFFGVMAITLDFESNNPSSNLGRTFNFFLIFYHLTQGLQQVIK